MDAYYADVALTSGVVAVLQRRYCSSRSISAPCILSIFTRVHTAHPISESKQANGGRAHVATAYTTIKTPLGYMGRVLWLKFDVRWRQISHRVNVQVVRTRVDTRLTSMEIGLRSLLSQTNLASGAQCEHRDSIGW